VVEVLVLIGVDICQIIFYIDNQALDPTDFGEFDSDTGIWKPIAYTGTYGTAGFLLRI
jgi:hypothetical protein